MSWNCTPIKPADADHIGQEIDAAGLMGLEQPEHRQQCEIAKAVAHVLVASGALGDSADGRMFLVSLSGHANPGHQPTPGWSNDAIQVYVRSEPADSDAVKYAREMAERWEEQAKLLKDVEIKA